MGDSKGAIGSESKGCFEALKGYATTKKGGWAKSIKNNPKRARNAEITGIVLLVIAGVGFLAVGVVGASSFMGATAWAPGFMGAINVTISSAGGWVPFVMTGVGGVGALELFGLMIFGVYKLIQSSKTRLEEKEGALSEEGSGAAIKQEAVFGKSLNRKTFELCFYPKGQVDAIFADTKVQQKNLGKYFLYYDSTGVESQALTMLCVLLPSASSKTPVIQSVTEFAKIESTVLSSSNDMIIIRLPESPKIKKEIVGDHKFIVGSNEYNIQVYERGAVKKLLKDPGVKAEIMSTDKPKAFVCRLGEKDTDHPNAYMIASKFNKSDSFKRVYYGPDKIELFKKDLKAIPDNCEVITNLERLEILESIKLIASESEESEESKDVDTVTIVVNNLDEALQVKSYIPNEIEAKFSPEFKANMGTARKVAFVFQINEAGGDDKKFVIFFKEGDGEYSSHMYESQETCKTQLDALQVNGWTFETDSAKLDEFKAELTTTDI